MRKGGLNMEKVITCTAMLKKGWKAVQSLSRVIGGKGFSKGATRVYQSSPQHGYVESMGIGRKQGRLLEEMQMEEQYSMFFALVRSGMGLERLVPIGVGHGSISCWLVRGVIVFIES